jgi:predicted ATPase
MRSASAGKPQVVFITGEAGIGKTALAEEFQRQVTAARPAMRLAHGQCVEGFGSKEPFYPVLQAVGQLCRGPAGAAVVDTLASHAPTWLVQFPALLTREHRETLKQEILGATRERMLREICEALETIAASVPLLLILEDLHWADSSTLDLVSALARHPMAARIMVIAAYRSTDVAHSAQPLHALKRDLVARHLCREVVLEPLGEAEITCYLAQGQSAAQVPEELASLLHHHTEGNPLFMIAVLEHLVGSGLVERKGSTWRLRRPAIEISLEVPESLRQMIGAQIDRLDESEQRVLEVAAIAGMSFTPVIAATRWRGAGTSCAWRARRSCRTDGSSSAIRSCTRSTARCSTSVRRRRGARCCIAAARSDWRRSSPARSTRSRPRLHITSRRAATGLAR